MTEYAGPGPIEGLLLETDEDTSPSPIGEEQRQGPTEPPETSIKELLSEASLPGSDVLSPSPPPRKRRSLGIG